MAATVPYAERFREPVRRALKNDFMRHSALVFSATMAGNVLNYLFNFALSRWLGVEGFATLSSLTSFIMIFSIPASILTLVVVKYTATFHAVGDSARVRRLSQVLLKWTCAAAAGALVLGVLFRSDISSFLRIPNDAAIPLCIGILGLSVITPSARGILQGEEDFVRYSASSVLEVLLKVVLAVVLVYYGFGVAGAMFGWMLGTACALAYTVWAVLRKHGSRSEVPVRLALDMRRLLQTTVGIGLAGGFLIILSFVDVLLVKHYFDPHQAGLYAAVNMTGKVVLFLASFVPAVMLPKVVSKSQRGENARALLLQAASITVVMSGAAVALFGTSPALVVRVLAGRDFIAAAPYVIQYDLAMCLLAVVTLLVNFRIGVHRFHFLIPLGLVLAAEIVVIVLYHRSLWDVIHVLLIGNAAAVVACLYRIRAADAQAQGAWSAA